MTAVWVGHMNDSTLLNAHVTWKNSFSKFILSHLSAHNIAILPSLAAYKVIDPSTCSQGYNFMLSVIVLDLEPVFIGEAKVFWLSLFQGQSKTVLGISRRE